MAGACSLLKRALVSLLLELARTYSLVLKLNRDSDDDKVKAGFRKVILRAHPDKPGGSEAATKRLTAAWEKWNRARINPKAPGRASSVAHLVVGAGRKKKEFRIHGLAIMLTYQGLADTSCWNSFLQFVADRLYIWKAKNWSATLETNADGSLHANLMLQFLSPQDKGVNNLRVPICYVSCEKGLNNIRGQEQHT